MIQIKKQFFISSPHPYNSGGVGVQSPTHPVRGGGVAQPLRRSNGLDIWSLKRLKERGEGEAIVTVLEIQQKNKHSIKLVYVINEERATSKVNYLLSS